MAPPSTSASPSLHYTPLHSTPLFFPTHIYIHTHPNNPSQNLNNHPHPKIPKLPLAGNNPNPRPEMDESWRMRMGPSPAPDKRSPELEPEDFDDVFGGPPRSVLPRKLSADFTGAGDWFYREIFRQDSAAAGAAEGGRRLPEFEIPAKGKCMARSRSTSWSAQSFDEFGGDRDVALSSYTSKLRPINIPNRWSSSSTSTTKPKKQELPPFGSTKTPYMNMNTNNNHGKNSSNKNYMMVESFNPGFPKIASFDTTMDEYDMEHLESPSSAVSSLSQAKTTSFSRDQGFERNPWESPDVKKNDSEEIDLCEAIAWAKEKFQGWSLDHDH